MAGGRNTLCERCYLASVARMYQVAHMVAQRERQPYLLERVLAAEA